MEIKVQPRQSGKSYDIAKIMKKDKNAVCIQPLMNLKHYFCKTYDIDPKRVFTAYELRNNPISLKEYNVYIDELNLVVEALLDANVVYATYTGKSAVARFVGDRESDTKPKGKVAKKDG